jgi:hypothetical protein
MGVSIPRWLKCICVCLLALATSHVSATIVGIFGSPSTGTFPGRISGLGYTYELWWSPTQVTESALLNVDVFYVHTARAPMLSNEAATISAWVNQGNGLIVEQPNQTGLVAILPPTLPISIWSKSYDGTNVGPDPVRAVVVTDVGVVHPVTTGLMTGDICENADRVLRSDVAAGYDILGVQISNANYVAVAAATYGLGRVVFHTGNTSPGAFSPGSDQYVQQMIDWAAVPEPAAAVATVVLAAFVRRRTK